MKHTCTYCETIKRSLGTLETHLRTHTEIPPFRIDEAIVLARKQEVIFIQNAVQQKKKGNSGIKKIKILKAGNILGNYKLSVIEILSNTPGAHAHIVKISAKKNVKDIESYIENNLNIDYKILFESKGFKFLPKKEKVKVLKVEEKSNRRGSGWIIYNAMGNKR